MLKMKTFFVLVLICATSIHGFADIRNCTQLKQNINEVHFQDSGIGNWTLYDITWEMKNCARISEPPEMYNISNILSSSNFNFTNVGTDNKTFTLLWSCTEETNGTSNGYLKLLLQNVTDFNQTVNIYKDEGTIISKQVCSNSTGTPNNNAPNDLTNSNTSNGSTNNITTNGTANNNTTNITGNNNTINGSPVDNFRQCYIYNVNKTSKFCYSVILKPSNLTIYRNNSTVSQNNSENGLYIGNNSTLYLKDMTYYVHIVFGSHYSILWTNTTKLQLWVTTERVLLPFTTNITLPNKKNITITTDSKRCGNNSGTTLFSLVNIGSIFLVMILTIILK